MKRNTLLAVIVLLAITSCEPNPEKDGIEINDSEDTLSVAKESAQKVFTRTYEELREDKEDVRVNLNEIKEEKPEKAVTNPRRVAEIENLLQQMYKKSEAFRNTTGDLQGEIKDEFDSLKHMANERIWEVKIDYKKTN